jgi:hypothetical protein
VEVEYSEEEEDEESEGERLSEEEIRFIQKKQFYCKINYPILKVYSLFKLLLDGRCPKDMH